MWEDSNYCWVVLCKNHWFHMRQNVFFRHRIPLAQTDAVDALPSLGKHFTVQCDECKKGYTYKPKDVRRVELELPESFKPHPLFQEEPFKDEPLDDSNRSTALEPLDEQPSQEGQPQAEQLQGEAHQEEPGQKETPPDERLPEGQTRAKAV